MQSTIPLEMLLPSLMGKSGYFVTHMFKISLHFEEAASRRALHTHLLLLKFA